MKTIQAAIVGASGYSGAELVRILSARSDVRVQRVTASASAGRKVQDLYPVFAGDVDLEYETLDAVSSWDVDVAFTALPSGESMQAVPLLLRQVPRVIDLSGDFRLADGGTYRTYYGRDHAAPDMLGAAVYGLPEILEGDIRNAHLVANPGCYATSILLALAPFVSSGVVSPDGIVVNSLSGVSGAGRSASVDLSFSEVNEDIRAYKLSTHQHIPEVEMILSRLAGALVRIGFVPHLVPLSRGIYTTIRASLSRPLTSEAACGLLREYYAGAPFVRPREGVPRLRDVVRTNYCDIHPEVDERTGGLIIISAIDNLVKGAAGQAVQNMNIMFDLPQDRGLREKGACS